MPGRRSRGWLLLALALVVGAILAMWASASQREAAGTVSVTVDVRQRLQVWDGFGSSERAFTDAHLGNVPQGIFVPPEAQREILSRLYGRLGLTRLRVLLDGKIQAKRGGPFDFGRRRGDDHISLVQEAKAAGLKAFFPAPANLEEWITANDVGPYVDYAMGVLRFWRSRGLEPPLYSPLNEPRIARNFPPQWLHDVVVQLGRRLEQEGFATKLVIPDDENPVDAYRRAEAVLVDPEARKYVAAVAFHIYKGTEKDWVPLKELAAKHGLPLWMTEYINRRKWGEWPGSLGWAVTIHDLITVGGVSAVDYLWAFFGDWQGPGGSYIALQFDSQGVYQTHTIGPLYYLTGQWSRYVRPGYRRVGASGDSRSILTTAFRGPKRVVIVSLNVSSVPQTVAYAVRGGGLGKDVAAVRTSATESWKVLPKLRTRAGSFSAQLPARSVTTLIVPLA